MRLAQTNRVPEMVNNLIGKLQKLVVGAEVEGIAMGQESTEFYRRLLKDNTQSLDKINAMVMCTMTVSCFNSAGLKPSRLLKLIRSLLVSTGLGQQSRHGCCSRHQLLP